MPFVAADRNRPRCTVWIPSNPFSGLDIRLLTSAPPIPQAHLDRIRHAAVMRELRAEIHDTGPSRLLYQLRGIARIEADADARIGRLWAHVRFERLRAQWAGDAWRRLRAGTNENVSNRAGGCGTWADL